MWEGSPRIFLGGQPAHAEAAILIGIFFGVTAKADFNPVIGLGKFPGVAVIQPVIRAFYLPAIFERLLENAKLIMDAVGQRKGYSGWRASQNSRRPGGPDRRCPGPVQARARSG